MGETRRRYFGGVLLAGLGLIAVPAAVFWQKAQESSSSPRAFSDKKPTETGTSAHYLRRSKPAKAEACCFTLDFLRTTRRKTLPNGRRKVNENHETACLQR